MSWSETSLIIQHFYNAFDIDRRMTVVEHKFPILAKDDGTGWPVGLEDEKQRKKLTKDTLWFILTDTYNSTVVKSVAKATQDGGPFQVIANYSVDMAKVPVESDVKAIVCSAFGWSTSNNYSYYDVLKQLFQYLKDGMPVSLGGTGRKTIGNNKILIGNNNNTYREIGVETSPVNNSSNLVTSGALAAVNNAKAPTNHAHTTTQYGVGSTVNYGHVKVDSNLNASDRNYTALSIAGANNLNTRINDTNTKIDNTKTELNTKIDNTKTELNTTINNTATALNTKIDNTKTELNTTINNTKTELNNTINTVVESSVPFASNQGDKTKPAVSNGGTAFGYRTRATGQDSMACGDNVNVGGTQSVGFGKDVNASGGDTVAVGWGAEATKVSSISIGHLAKAYGEGSVVIGKNTNNSTNRITSIGEGNIANNDSVSVGYQCHTRGEWSVGVGNNIELNNINSVAIGMGINQSGDGSVGIGVRANGSGGVNVVIGADANTTGNNAVVVGHASTASNASSVSLGHNIVNSSDLAIAIGAYSTIGNGSRSGIVMGQGARVGSASEGAIAIGEGTIVGDNCGFAIAIGESATARDSSSIAIGWASGVREGAEEVSCISIGAGANSGGHYSMVIGSYSNIRSNGYNNIIVGHDCNIRSDTASQNTVIGSNAECKSDALGGNTLLGYWTKADSGARDSTALGIGAHVWTNDMIQLGDSSTLSILNCRVSLTVTSDERDKTDIEEIKNGALDFLNKIKAVRYVLNERQKYLPDDYYENKENEKRTPGGIEGYDKEEHSKGTKKGERKRVGVIAQEVQKALTETYGSADYANLINDNLYDLDPSTIPDDVENQLTANYEAFVPFLIKGIQELSQEVQVLKARVAMLEKEVIT